MNNMTRMGNSSSRKFAWLSAWEEAVNNVLYFYVGGPWNDSVGGLLLASIQWGFI